MSTRDRFLDNLSALLEQRIENDSLFFAGQGIQVFAERKGLLEQTVRMALASITATNNKCGLAIIVRMPLVDRSDADASGWLRVLAEVSVIEAPFFNYGEQGFRVSSGEVWTNLLRLLDGWRVEVLQQTLSAAQVPMQFKELEAELMTDLRLHCFYPVRPVEKCSIGVMELEHVAGNTYKARAATPTAGASIHFKFTAETETPLLPTTEDTARATGEWFEFEATTPGVIQAVAYATGKLASDALCQTLTA